MQLLRLWEESLYQEFIAARSHGPNGEAREVRKNNVMNQSVEKEISFEFVTRKAERNGFSNIWHLRHYYCMQAHSLIFPSVENMKENVH